MPAGGMMPVSHGSVYPAEGWVGPSPYADTSRGGPVPGHRYVDANGRVVNRQEYDPNAWDSNRPIEKALEYVFGEAQFRFDYLDWQLDMPGNASLGAPVSGVQNTREPFEVFDRVTGASRGNAIVPTLDTLSLRDVPGMRGMMTLPYKDFSLEVNAFFTGQTGDSVTLDPSRLGTLVATTLTVNGSPATDGALIYDQLFTADLTSQLWGAEGNILLADPLGHTMYNGLILNLEPLVGFRYLQLDEMLHQQGTDTNAGTISPALTSVINSTTINNIYGPTLGIRIEARSKFLTFGVQPKITFALNDYSAAVYTADLFAAGETPTITRIEEIDYTALFEFNAYLKWHVTESCNIHVGYDYMFASRVARPYKAIRYDSIRLSGTNAPNVRVQRDLDDFFLQGLTVGAEFRL